MKFMYEPLINFIFITKSTSNVILQALESIFLKLSKKNQYFHTSTGLDLVEGVTTITSQLHRVCVWDYHKFHLHNTNNLPWNFEWLENNIPRDVKEKSIFSYFYWIGRCYHH